MRRSASTTSPTATAGFGRVLAAQAAGRRILKLIEVLDLSNVTLVANEHFPGWSSAEVANRVNQSGTPRLWLVPFTSRRG